MFEFSNPAAFLLLLLIPLLFILRKFKIFTKITFPAVLSDWEGHSFSWDLKARKLLSNFARGLVGAGFTLIVTAIADPVITHQHKVYTSLGTDIVFVVDTSPSMAARDMNGISRLETAKSTIEKLMAQHEGYRYGIVAVGTEAAVFVPPTGDFACVAERMGELSVGILGNGSAIGDGISTAVCHLAASTAPRKCIILLTDGENNAGEIHPETAAELSHSNGIALYVVGIGTKGSVPIEYTDPATGKLYSGYLDSNFDAGQLKKLAEASEGRYFEAVTAGDLEGSLSLIAKTENTAQNYTYRNESKTYYKQILLAGAILIILSWFIKRIILGEKF